MLAPATESQETTNPPLKETLKPPGAGDRVSATFLTVTATSAVSDSPSGSAACTVKV